MNSKKRDANFQGVEVEYRQFSQQIADQIQTMITRGELKPGDRLPSERELSAQLQVSRNVLREAVKLLNERGLVVIRAGSGTYVSEIQASAISRSIGLYVQQKQVSIGHLFEVRWMLEVETTNRAAQNATPEEIGELEQSIAKTEQAGDDLEAFVKADIGFHKLLAVASHNPLLPILLDTIIELLYEQSRIASITPTARENALRHHRKILWGVKNKSGLLAAQAMRDHLVSGWEWLVTEVEKLPDKNTLSF